MDHKPVCLLGIRCIPDKFRTVSRCYIPDYKRIVHLCQHFLQPTQDLKHLWIGKPGSFSQLCHKYNGSCRLPGEIFRPQIRMIIQLLHSFSYFICRLLRDRIRAVHHFRYGCRRSSRQFCHILNGCSHRSPSSCDFL